MNFKTYLKEAAVNSDGTTIYRSKPISSEQAKDLLQKNCQQITKYYATTPKRIYRGIMEANFPYAIVEPSKYTRLSLNTSNFYTILFDNMLLNWDSFPKRSKSIICSTTENTASVFSNDGSYYTVYPYDNAKIAFAPTEDFWDSFKTICDLVPVLNISDLNTGIFAPIYRLAGPCDYDNINANQFYRAFEIFDRYLNENKRGELLGQIESNTDDDDGYFNKNGLRRIIDAMRRPYDIRKFLEGQLGPNLNGFKLQQLPQINIPNRPEGCGVEAWTDATSILVEADYY